MLRKALALYSPTFCGLIEVDGRCIDFTKALTGRYMSTRDSRHMSARLGYTLPSYRMVNKISIISHT